MFFRHSAYKLIYPLIAAALIISFSYRPRYRLRDEMPAEFFSEATISEPRGQDASREKSIAWAYWQSAQMDIQWKFPHGRVLPLNPPPDFRIQQQTVKPNASDAALRQHYWSRLRQVWNSPEVWRTEYVWDWTWISDPLPLLEQWKREVTERLFSFHK